MPGNIKAFSHELNKLVESFSPKPIASNLCKSEKMAIKSLKGNTKIVIRKADKGATTVVLDKQQYINEAESQLNNPRFYSPLADGADLGTRERIEPILLDLLNNGHIKKKQFNFLLGEPDSHRDRVFYSVPKIHKSLESWYRPPNMPRDCPPTPPGRPIVSDVGSQTYQIGKYISSQLKDLATSHKSYLKDTYDFLDKLKRLKVPPNAALVTLDVKSLYTNIDNQKGIDAVRRTMLRNPDPNRPDAQLLELLEICLTHNSFSFNGKKYIQTNGAAMGHSYCVEYANIDMADWEVEAIKKCPLRPLFWARFIDDIIIVWTHGRPALEIFVRILNSHDQNIQVTYDYQTFSINFLDVEIYKGRRFEREGIFDTRVHFKETDSHQLLHHASFHPKATFSSVVKSQVLRFYRICNNDYDFNTACSILFRALKPRGYSERMLRRIKHDIVHADTPTRMHSAGRSQPCMGPRCTRCPLINKCSSLEINGFSFTIKNTLDCNSQGVIYVIQCQKCDVSYVGETGNMLRTRLNQHINDIQHQRDTAVANHFNLSNHYIDTDFLITPILSELNLKYRRCLESWLISKFGTENPTGLNEKAGDTERADKITPIVIPFSLDSNTFCHETKRLAEKYKVCDSKIITAFNRHRNLKDLLAPSKLPNN